MIESLLASFLGFTLGRIGHIYGGHLSFIPHHWIFGFILIVAPVFIEKITSKKIALLVFLFGFGLLVSDFKDFLELKIFDPENVDILKFWGVD